MIKVILNALRKPSAQTIAAQELEEAKRDLLLAQSAAEYATQISQYHLARIKRLSEYTKEPQ